MILFLWVGYALFAGLSLRFIALQWAAHSLREYSNLYPDGRFTPDAGDLFFVALLALVWPIGVLIAWNLGQNPSYEWARFLFEKEQR